MAIHRTAAPPTICRNFTCNNRAAKKAAVTSAITAQAAPAIIARLRRRRGQRLGGGRDHYRVVAAQRQVHQHDGDQTGDELPMLDGSGRKRQF